MMRIRKGDTVIIIAGKDKGKTGKVMKIISKKNKIKKGNIKVIVEGANLVFKCVKANPAANIEGKIMSMEAPLEISNIALLNPSTNKADRVGFKFITKDGISHKVRYFKSNNELVDIV